MPEFGTFGPFIRAVWIMHSKGSLPSSQVGFGGNMWGEGKVCEQYIIGPDIDTLQGRIKKSLVWEEAFQNTCMYRTNATCEKVTISRYRNGKKKLTMTKSLFLAMLIFLLSAKFSNWNKFRGGGQKTTPPPTLSCASQIGNVRQKTLFQPLPQPVFRFKLYSSPFSSDIRKGKGGKKSFIVI